MLYATEFLELHATVYLFTYIVRIDIIVECQNCCCGAFRGIAVCVARLRAARRLSSLLVISAAAVLTVSAACFDLAALVAASVCVTRCGGALEAVVT